MTSATWWSAAPTSSTWPGSGPLSLLQGRATGRPEATDPLDHADELLRLTWEHRWPRRPRWLSRRLHGDGPRRAERD